MDRAPDKASSPKSRDDVLAPGRSASLAMDADVVVNALTWALNAVPKDTAPSKCCIVLSGDTLTGSDGYALHRAWLPTTVTAAPTKVTRASVAALRHVLKAHVAAGKERDLPVTVEWWGLVVTIWVGTERHDQELDPHDLGPAPSAWDFEGPRFHGNVLDAQPLAVDRVKAAATWQGDGLVQFAGADQRHVRWEVRSSSGTLLAVAILARLGAGITLDQPELPFVVRTVGDRATPPAPPVLSAPPDVAGMFAGLRRRAPDAPILVTYTLPGDAMPPESLGPWLLLEDAVVSAPRPEDAGASSTLAELGLTSVEATELRPSWAVTIEVDTTEDDEVRAALDAAVDIPLEWSAQGDRMQVEPPWMTLAPEVGAEEDLAALVRATQARGLHPKLVTRVCYPCQHCARHVSREDLAPGGLCAASLKILGTRSAARTTKPADPPKPTKPAKKTTKKGGAP